MSTAIEIIREQNAIKSAHSRMTVLLAMSESDIEQCGTEWYNNELQAASRTLARLVIAREDNQNTDA